MAIAIRFDPAKADLLLQSISTGKTIEAPRNIDEILALAGACFFHAMSRAPELHKGVDWERLGKKPKEQSEEAFLADLQAAIEYYAHLMMLVAVGEYEENFTGPHEAIVLVQKDHKTVIPLAGTADDNDND